MYGLGLGYGTGMLSPPQRPPTVALGRNARRLGRGKRSRWVETRGGWE